MYADDQARPPARRRGDTHCQPPIALLRQATPAPRRMGGASSSGRLRGARCRARFAPVRARVARRSEGRCRPGTGGEAERKWVQAGPVDHRNYYGNTKVAGYAEVFLVCERTFRVISRTLALSPWAVPAGYATNEAVTAHRIRVGRDAARRPGSGGNGPRYRRAAAGGWPRRKRGCRHRECEGVVPCGA